METTKISLLKENKGQIEGLPRNPRETGNLDKLIKSIKDIPYFLEARPVVIIKHKGESVIIAGHQRVKAAKKLGMAEIPTYTLAEDTPVKELKEIAIIDNVHSGKWDKAKLKEWDNIKELGVPVTDAAIKREWRKQEKKFLLQKKYFINKKNDFNFISLYAESKEGEVLEDIKADEGNIAIIGRDVSELLSDIVGELNNTWAIITTPKRRHKEHNFSSEICKEIAKRSNIKFYDDAIEAKNRQRINPIFALCKPIKEKNIVLFDDIVTTGSTIKATRELLKNKTILVIIAINNS